ncbi:hypothetical protein TNCV_2848431, partial [Trichonephila clavipes]
DRVVVYSASTSQVWGSINGLHKVDTAFHPHIGSINEYQACFRVLNTEGLSSDRPPNQGNLFMHLSVQWSRVL